LANINTNTEILKHVGYQFMHAEVDSIGTSSDKEREEPPLEIIGYEFKYIILKSLLSL